MAGQPIITSLRMAQAFFAGIAHETVEVAAFAYLDPVGLVVGLRVLRSPSASEIAVSLRRVVADALAFDAVGMVMAHAHPGGSAQPSDADLRVTRDLALTLSRVGIRLYDHLVVSRTAITSFRANGLL